MSASNPEARRIGDRAFQVFKSAFEPFARECLTVSWGAEWEYDLGYRARDASIGQPSIRRLGDPQELLSLLTDRATRERCFAGVDGVDLRAVAQRASTAKARRNDLAHHQPFEAEDALEAVHTVNWLLTAFGLTEEAAELVALEAEAVAMLVQPADDASRAEYLDALDRRTRMLDLGGISHKVSGASVRQALEAVYVEPKFLSPARETASRDGDASDFLNPFDDNAQREREGDWLRLVPPDPRLSLEDLRVMQRLVIVAPPGAGKTSLLRREARWQAFQSGVSEPPLPILLRAADVAESLHAEPTMRLTRYLAQRASDRWGGLYSQAVSEQRAVLLVDGLDEIGNQADRTRLSRRIVEFGTDHPGIRIWVTSRGEGYRGSVMSPEFERLSIAPLDEFQRSDVLRRWHQTLSEDTPDTTDDEGGVERLEEEIALSPDLASLAENPLLLTILYLIWSRNSSLPTRRVSLYEAAVDTLLGDWPAHRLGATYAPSHFLDWLQPVAKEMIARGEVTVGERELRERLQSHFASLEGLSLDRATDRADEALRIVEEHTGFLVEETRHGGERHFGFLHRTFAEYLAGLELAEDWERSEIEWASVLYDGRWTEAARFMAAHVGATSQARASRLLRDMLAAPTIAEPLVGKGVRRALVALADGATVEHGLRDEILQSAVELCLTCQEPRLLVGTARLLARVARSQPVGPMPLADASRSDEANERLAMLTAILRPEDWTAQCRAAEAFTEQRERTAKSDDQAMATAGFDGLALLAIEDICLAGRSNTAYREVDDPVGVCLVGDGAGDWLLDTSAVDRLSEAGWPIAGVGELYEDPARAWAGVHWRSRPDPSVPQLIHLIELRPDLAEVEAVWPGEEWYAANAEALRNLDPSSLPPEVAWTPHSATLTFHADDAWEDLVFNMAAEGTGRARLAAIKSVASGFTEEWHEVGEKAVLDACLRDPAPEVRHSVVCPGGAVQFGAEADTQSRCETLLDDPVDWVRGGALRGLLEAGVGNPFGAIARPELFVFGPPGVAIDEDLGSVIGRLARFASRQGPRERRILVDAAARLMLESPLKLSSVERDDDTELVLLEIVSELLRGGRPEAMLNALLLHAQLPNRPALGPLIATALQSTDPAVRSAAASIVRPVDVAGVGVLSDVLHALLDGGSAADAFIVGDELIDATTDSEEAAMTIADARILVDAFATDHPQSATAQAFAYAIT